MIFKKLWERHFLYELLKVFFLFIFSFFGLYILIDYSSRGGLYYSSGLKFGQLTLYYAMVLIKRLDILVPFALILSTVKALTGLNARNEIVALLNSGVKLKRLMRPFILFALFLTVLLYLNSEFLLPYANRHLNYIKDAYFKDRYRSNMEDNVHFIDLEEGRGLAFHGYDTAKNRLFDVFYLVSLNKIYHMKSLYPYQSPPIGASVDLFERDASGNLLLKASYKERSFQEILFNEGILQQSLRNPKEEPLSELWANAQFFQKDPSEKQAETLTVFFHKLLIPWLCLLAVIGPAPFCLRFSRQLPTFFIYLFSMVGIVAFYLIMNAALIMGENQALSPAIAICTPFAFYFLFFGWKYAKLT